MCRQGGLGNKDKSIVMTGQGTKSRLGSGKGVGAGGMGSRGSASHNIPELEESP